MSRQDRLAWIVIGDSVAVVLGFGARVLMFPVTGATTAQRASAPASPSSVLDGVFGIRRVPPASPCGSSPQSYDDAVRSGRHLLRRSNTSALPRVEGSLPCHAYYFASGSSSGPCWPLAACGLARIAVIPCAHWLLHRVLRGQLGPDLWSAPACCLGLRAA